MREFKDSVTGKDDPPRAELPVSTVHETTAQETAAQQREKEIGL